MGEEVAKKLWMRWQVRAMKYETALRGIRAAIPDSDGSTLAWWVRNECDKALKEAKIDPDHTAAPADA